MRWTLFLVFGPTKRQDRCQSRSRVRQNRILRLLLNALFPNDQPRSFMANCSHNPAASSIRSVRKPMLILIYFTITSRSWGWLAFLVWCRINDAFPLFAMDYSRRFWRVHLESGISFSFVHLSDFTASGDRTRRCRLAR